MGSLRARSRGVFAAPLLAAAALVLALALAPSKAAAGPFQIGVYEDTFLSADQSTRESAYDAAAGTNSELVRLSVSWRSIVGATPPADPTDPDDPAYDFSALDAAVRDAAARGLGVMFTGGPAPDWAEGAGRPGWARPGVWKPDPDAYGDFARALAQRYSGSFADPLGPGTLPRVRFYEAWNEPNLNYYLAPQFEGGKPTGVEVYRALLNSFAAGVKSVRGDNKVVGPGTAPFGGPAPGSSQQTRTRPVSFLRDLLCLKGRKKLKPKGCPERARIDVLSHHPIVLSGKPDYNAQSPDDASGGDLDRVRRVLEAAERAGTISPGGRRPLWATEYWWRSDPPNKSAGLSLRKHARYIAESLYVFWRDGADAAFYFDMIDASDSPGFGLLTDTLNKKPGYRALEFPFVTDRKSRRKITAWGKAPRSGKLKVQRKRKGKWRTMKKLRVRDGKVFKKKLKLRGKGKLRAVVGPETSLVWKQRG